MTETERNVSFILRVKIYYSILKCSLALKCFTNCNIFILPAVLTLGGLNSRQSLF